MSSDGAGRPAGAVVAAGLLPRGGQQQDPVLGMDGRRWCAIGPGGATLRTDSDSSTMIHPGVQGDA